MKLLLLFALCAAASFGQVIPNRYVLELSGEPAATAARPRAAAFAVQRSAVRQRQAAARAAVAARGGTVVESLDTVFNGLIVTIPDAAAASLLQIPGAVRLHTVRRVRPLLSHALPLHKVPDAWNLLPLGQNGAGAGMKIAMIDSGIDVNNPAFSDPLPPVDGFPKVLAASDTRFTNAKIIVAKNYTKLLPDGGEPSADDVDGHGTGTALAAAGGPASTPYGPVIGVAPKAYLGNYKVLDTKGGTSDVIAKAIDDAVADGMDAINISLGSYVLSYSDIDTSEVGIAAIERATRAGVLVAVAAGNQGPAAGTLSDYASAPDAIVMGAIHNDRSLGYAITIDGVAPYPAFGSDGPNPGQALGGTLFDVTQLDASGLACSPLPAGSAAGKIVLVLRGTCTFESKVNDVAASGALAIVVYDNPGNSLFSSHSVTVGAATLPALFVNLADGLDLKARAAANSGVQVTLDFSGAIGFPARTDVTSFSSRGPNVGSALKPDLAAVGEEIVTGAQSTNSAGESYSASGFIDTAGTSFSSPLAAGAAAVLKAARPGLTGQQYRSLLVNGAMPATISDGVSASVSQAGAGVLNLLAAVTGTVAAYPTSLSFGSGSGTVHSTLQLSLTNVGSALDTFTLQAFAAGSAPVPSLDAGTVVLDTGASQQVAVTLDASDLAPGEYSGWLLVSGTANPTVARIPYWFGVAGGAPARISLLYQDYSDGARANATQAVVVRIVDAAGLPYTGSLRPAVTADSGTIRNLYRTGTIPGTYAVDIRMGTTNMSITIAIGGLTETVLIPVI